MTLLDRERLVTRTGVRLEVRAARAEDERALAAFFAKVTPEDMRFRFLSTKGAPGHDQLLALLEKPSGDGESLIAWGEDGTGATAPALAGRVTESLVVLVEAGLVEVDGAPGGELR